MYPGWQYVARTVFMNKESWLTCFKQSPAVGVAAAVLAALPATLEYALNRLVFHLAVHALWMIPVDAVVEPVLPPVAVIKGGALQREEL